MTPTLAEGWYLMSPEDLERELRRMRAPKNAIEPSDARLLSIDEALAYRDAGNLPDERGRTLRLVLRVDSLEDLEALDRKRLAYEPDFHDPPEWRIAGSRPVNVVPLRAEGVVVPEAGPWWEDEGVADLETEWRAHGTVAGIQVPGDYRGFVFKTVLSLRAAGRDVTPDSIADSIARWLSPEDAARIAGALRRANT